MDKREFWAIIIILIACLLLWGCVEEENCITTDEIDYFRTEETKFYTITVPVYKVVCE